MLYLLLAIICSAMVSIVMRLSSDKVTNNLGMLVMNYLMCTLAAAANARFDQLFALDARFFLASGMGIVNGCFYLISFVLLQVNVRRNGVVLSSTFMKLGLLVSIVVSVCFYHEIPDFVQILGFLLAVGAILLINFRQEAAGTGFKPRLLWLLLCGGMADAMSKIFEESGAAQLAPQFLFYTFLTALVLCAALVLRRGQPLGKWEVLYGLLIGVPNFMSSRFLLRALEDVAAVIAYPVYSVGGILIVTLTGVLAFRERLRRRQWLGIGMILVALVLLNIP